MSTTVEPVEPSAAAPTPVEPRERGGNAVGIAAFVCGALALGPVAVILGLAGLARYRSGKASRRSWPLAGLILGVVGTIALAVGGYLYATSDASEVAADAHAKVDVIHAGNAAVDYFTANPKAASIDVAALEDGYAVADVSVPTTLTGERSLAAQATDAYEWCLTLTYEGGSQSSVAFAATTGVVAACPAS